MQDWNPEKYYRDKLLPVFDIYKDFLGLNRALRKQIASEKSKNLKVLMLMKIILD